MGRTGERAFINRDMKRRAPARLCRERERNFHLPRMNMSERRWLLRADFLMHVSLTLRAPHPLAWFEITEANAKTNCPPLAPITWRVLLNLSCIVFHKACIFEHSSVVAFCDFRTFIPKGWKTFLTQLLWATCLTADAILRTLMHAGNIQIFFLSMMWLPASTKTT
jgi:hypothetical protein